MCVCVRERECVCEKESEREGRRKGRRTVNLRRPERNRNEGYIGGAWRGRFPDARQARRGINQFAITPFHKSLHFFSFPRKIFQKLVREGHGPWSFGCYHAWDCMIRRSRGTHVLGLGIRCSFLLPSLSLSFSHTHTFSLTHTHTLSLSHTHTHIHTLSLLHTQTNAHAPPSSR